MMTRKQTLAIGAGALLLVLVAAGASAMITKSVLTEEPAKTEKVVTKAKPSREKITWNDNAPAPQPQQRVACSDGNVVGHVVGGVAGGVAGNQVGSGNGQTAATIAGTLGGAYLGGRYLPTNNVTCR